jgi:23S rRNA pseudouridine1911/1915/1917 synthase
MPAQEHIQLHAEVPESLDGERLDVVASSVFSQYSRSRLQQWIKSGHLTVDGEVLKPRDKIFAGQELKVDIVLETPDEAEKAQNIGIDIVYEDDSIIVINKPVGLVVHPGAGNANNTLMNALLYYCPQLTHVPRAGIVHRLDKDTSGLMVVAKTLDAHNSLVEQLHEREVNRQYYALVQGVMTAGGTVNAPIGRHRTNRQKQAVVESGGREAITHYRVVKKFRAHTLVRCQLETGRTHQIRVHMAHIRFPLLGDKLYAGRPRLPKAASPEMIEMLQQFPRQVLHAFKLGLVHPVTDQVCEWEIDLPDDIKGLLAVLKQDVKDHQES